MNREIRERLLSQGVGPASHAVNMLIVLARGHSYPPEEILQYADDLERWVKDVRACRSEAVVPDDDDDLGGGHGL